MSAPEQHAAKRRWFKRKRWVCSLHPEAGTERVLDPDTSWAAGFMSVCRECRKDDYLVVV